jgi:hypothetical protein
MNNNAKIVKIFATGKTFGVFLFCFVLTFFFSLLLSLGVHCDIWKQAKHFGQLS